ncbi:MAG: hypothetical protein AAFW95_05675 [Cyanobacteria bacterium J06638_6]
MASGEGHDAIALETRDRWGVITFKRPNMLSSGLDALLPRAYG